MKIITQCEGCSKSLETTQYRQSVGRGRFCSRSCKSRPCRSSGEERLQKFHAKHGQSPTDLAKFLSEKRITLTGYAKLSSIPVGTLSHELKHFGVVPYKHPLKTKSIFRCASCGKEFQAYDRPSRINRNVFCSQQCRKDAARIIFNEGLFRITDYKFLAPAKALGNYQDLVLGKRQKCFVNGDKVNHFFFREGIHNEATAYFYGLLITDGSLHRSSRGAFCVRLQMTDVDIIKKVSALLQNKNRLYEEFSRRTATILFSSPYLYHDLCALGCVPNKTPIANYPLTPALVARHLIRGIIDGDGSWVMKRDGSMLLQICGNDLLLYGVYQKILQQVGVSPQSAQYLIDYDTRIKMKSLCLVKYNMTDSLKIRDWLYQSATIFGDRKFKKAHSNKPPYTERITTVRLAATLGVAADFVKKAVTSSERLPRHRVGPYYYFVEDELPIWIEYLKLRLAAPNCRLPNRQELRQRWGIR